MAASDASETLPPTSTRIGRSTSTLEAESVAETLKLAIASFSLLGVGCSAGYYLAPAGFFEYKFKDTAFFLWMLIALFLPVPLVLLLQEKFDEHFDAMFGPRQTYFFRVIAVQMILAAVFACYSLSCSSRVGVILCGVCIGAFGGATLSSTMQLISVWDPHLTAWATLGRDVAGALPVVTYLALAFSASAATPREFRSMQLFPIFLICLCSICLTGLHSAGTWDKVYSRLGYDLWDPDRAHIRQECETDPLLAPHEVDSSGAALWTPKWHFANGFNAFLSFLPLPLVTLMRDPDLTQKLTLGKLGMDCLARCVAAYLARTEVFGITRPRHLLLVAQLTLRTTLLSMLLLRLLHYVVLPVNLLTFAWLLHHFSGSLVSSQIDVTIVRFAPVVLRKAISRRNTLASFLGLALSLAVDVIATLQLRASVLLS